MRAPALLSLFTVALAACGGSDRGGRGYVVVVARDGNINGSLDARGDEDAEPIEGRDAGDDPMRNDGSGFRDANDEPRLDAETFPDAWSPGDAGFEDAETFPDAAIPDTGRPDFGIPFPPPDAGRPDAGRPDTGQPDTGQSDSGTPPAFQTTVSVPGGTSQVILNLVPPVAADPLTFSVELTYDNVGPGSQNISITSVDVTALIFPLQNFQAGPAHNAPVGITTQVVNKTAGTGQPLSTPETYCGLPAIVTINVSNGQQIQDFGVVTCQP